MKKYAAFPQLVAFALMVLSVSAEDWTVDGKTYSNVKVVKVEADSVTILDASGGARLELAKMPSELQKRFNYDPAKAQAVSEERARQQTLAKAASTAQSQEMARRREKQANLEEIAKHPFFMQGYVLQKTPEGVLVQCNEPAVVADSSASVGGGGNVYIPPDDCPPGTKRIYGTFLLKNAPNQESMVDKDSVKQVCYPAGTFSYTTVLGAQKSIAAYTAVLPGN